MQSGLVHEHTQHPSGTVPVSVLAQLLFCSGAISMCASGKHVNVVHTGMSDGKSAAQEHAAITKAAYCLKQLHIHCISVPNIDQNKADCNVSTHAILMNMVCVRQQSCKHHAAAIFHQMAHTCACSIIASIHRHRSRLVDGLKGCGCMLNGQHSKA